MTRIDRVKFKGKTYELTIPVYLSDDEVELAGTLSDPEKAAALFVLNIIQKQIEQLMADTQEKEMDEEEEKWMI